MIETIFHCGHCGLSVALLGTLPSVEYYLVYEPGKHPQIFEQEAVVLQWMRQNYPEHVNEKADVLTKEWTVASDG